MAQLDERLDSHKRNGPGFGLCVVVVLTLYAAGLTRQIDQPWTGLHDFNGAIYSLFARNFLRYPWEIHHGMPIIAVGDHVPPVEERSIYPNHPAGLVWLLAGVFRLFGESERNARLLSIIASLGSVAILMSIVARRWDAEKAVGCGLIYSVLPLTVYFGRMVDHEAVGLALMLLAVASWDVLTDPLALRVRRRAAGVVFAAAVVSGIWLDWSGALFAGLFALHIISAVFRRRISTSAAAILIAVIVCATAGMLLHIVYCGFDGRWGDLLALFLSRSGAPEVGKSGRTWTFLKADVTALGALLTFGGSFVALAGILADFRKKLRRVLDDGLWVLLATGLLWVAIFHRQFQIHNYWIFYLGPFVALAAVWSLAWIRDAANRATKCAGTCASLLLLALLIGFGMHGAGTFFAVVNEPQEDIEAFQQIRRMTSPDDRIFVFPDPTLKQNWGQTKLRLIKPPQFPYYTDRPFDVTGDLAVITRRDGGQAMFLVDLEAITAGSSGLASLSEQFAGRRYGNLALFDLRRPRVPTSEGVSEQR